MDTTSSEKAGSESYSRPDRYQGLGDRYCGRSKQEFHILGHHDHYIRWGLGNNPLVCTREGYSGRNWVGCHCFGFAGSHPGSVSLQIEWSVKKGHVNKAIDDLSRSVHGNHGWG